MSLPTTPDLNAPQHILDTQIIEFYVAKRRELSYEVDKMKRELEELQRTLGHLIYTLRFINFFRDRGVSKIKYENMYGNMMIKRFKKREETLKKDIYCMSKNWWWYTKTLEDDYDFVGVDI